MESYISTDVASTNFVENTVKPVNNDHLYNKIYYQWFIQ